MKRKSFGILSSTGAQYEPPAWNWNPDLYVPGESAFSLLARFQALNALSCAAVLQMFTCPGGRSGRPHDIDLRDARRFDIWRMVTLLNLSIVEVANAFILPSYRRASISISDVRRCDLCAADGVHLTVFQDRSVERCPRHGTLLTRRCGNCGLKIAYRLNARSFRASCPSCGAPWLMLDHNTTAQRRGEARCDNVRGPRRRSPLVVAIAAAMNSRGSVSGGENAEPSRNAAAVVITDRLLVPSEGLDTQAYATYRAARRWVMSHYGRAHRSCLASAERFLRWDLTGCTTSPFCPTALAITRWRSKWEGCSVPSTLTVRSVHEPLGVAIWLSTCAPILPDNFDHDERCRETLRILSKDCIRSFHSFLDEAEMARDHDRVLWLPFPIKDYDTAPRRILPSPLRSEQSTGTAVAGYRDAVRCCSKAEREFHAQHVRRHRRLLWQNRAPDAGAVFEHRVTRLTPACGAPAAGLRPGTFAWDESAIVDPVIVYLCH